MLACLRVDLQAHRLRCDWLAQTISTRLLLFRTVHKWPFAVRKRALLRSDMEDLNFQAELPHRAREQYLTSANHLACFLVFLNSAACLHPMSLLAWAVLSQTGC